MPTVWRKTTEICITNRRCSRYEPESKRRRGLELLTLLFQEFLHFDGGHATGARRRDGLAIAAILHVAARVNPMHARENIVVSLKIAVGISVELAGEHLRIRLVADAEKQRARGKIPDPIRLHIAQLKPGHFIMV